MFAKTESHRKLASAWIGLSVLVLSLIACGRKDVDSSEPVAAKPRITQIAVTPKSAGSSTSGLATSSNLSVSVVHASRKISFVVSVSPEPSISEPQSTEDFTYTLESMCVDRQFMVIASEQRDCDFVTFLLKVDPIRSEEVASIRRAFLFEVEDDSRLRLRSIQDGDFATVRGASEAFAADMRVY